MYSASQNSHSWKIFSFVIFVICIAAVGTSVYFYQKLQNISNPAYQQEFIEKETDRILSKVGSIYALPEGTPQIAVVSNPEELKKGQPFFERAMVDDRILIYPEQAILYRPSTHQIINIWPVSRAEPSPTPVENSTSTNTEA